MWLYSRCCLDYLCAEAYASHVHVMGAGEDPLGIGWCGEFLTSMGRIAVTSAGPYTCSVGKNLISLDTHQHGSN